MYNERIENVFFQRGESMGGESMVTIRTIAEKSGLSIAAVSKALHGQPGISPERAAEVKRVAQELGYFPNAAAQTLKTNRSRNIGILFQNRLAHEYFSNVLESIRDTAEVQGYDITLLSSHYKDHPGFYEHAKHRRCDGVIIVQAGADQEGVRRLAEGDIPVVSIDRIFNGRTAIVNDNVGSTQSIICYLHELGHREIAIIHGEDGDVTQQRLAGFYRGCQDCGIDVPDEYVIPACYHEPADSGRAVKRLMALKRRPSCILFPDDVCYLGGLTALESMGLSVPEDVSCFGYDGIQMAGILRPSLATYRQNAAEIGRQAAEQLISAIEKPKFFAPQVLTVTGSIQPGGTVRDLRKEKGCDGDEKGI